MKAGGSSQNEMLFMRGNAMSGAPIMIGTIQLAKPPMSAGMTMKKIMMRPWPRDEHVVDMRIAEDLDARLVQFGAHRTRTGRRRGSP